MFPRIVFALALGSSSATGSLITFDNIATGPISAGYGGLTWNNFAVEDGPANPNSGYEAGVVSPTQAAYNTGGNAASFDSQFGGAEFILVNLSLTAAWEDNLQVVVSGYLNGILTPGDSTTVTLSATTPTLFTFNWFGIDSVHFSASGGTHHPGYAGDGTAFVMDDLQVDAIGTPEPGTMVLMVGVALGYVVKRLLSGRT